MLVPWWGVKKTKQNTLASWKKSYDQRRQHIKKKRHHFAYQGLYSQSYGFSGSHVWIWEVDHKEGWAMLSNCDAGEDSWESLGQQGNQSWIFIGRTKAEAEAPVLWPPDAKSQLIGKDWCWERLKIGGEWVTEDEMIGWHHQLNGHDLSKFREIVKDREG